MIEQSLSTGAVYSPIQTETSRTEVSRQPVTHHEVELGREAVKAASGYYGFLIFSILLVSLAVGVAMASQARGDDGFIMFPIGAGGCFVVLLPFWLRAKAYSYDMKRRHSYMDRT